jgi:hypothetical protein
MEMDMRALIMADRELTRGGPELKLLLTPSGSIGGLFGGRGVSYQTDEFYVGGAGYGGLLASNGTATGGVGYGGLLAGFERKLQPDWTGDLAILIGAGGGASSAGAGGSVVIEPEASLSRAFGGTRLTLGLGYLYLPTLAGVSGVTVGLRLESKQLTLTMPVPD